MFDIKLHLNIIRKCFLINKSLHTLFHSL